MKAFSGMSKVSKTKSNLIRVVFAKFRFNNEGQRWANKGVNFAVVRDATRQICASYGNMKITGLGKENKKCCKNDQNLKILSKTKFLSTISLTNGTRTKKSSQISSGKFPH
jgi:hypothetical protein